MRWLRCSTSLPDGDPMGFNTQLGSGLQASRPGAPSSCWPTVGAGNESPWSLSPSTVMSHLGLLYSVSKQTGCAPAPRMHFPEKRRRTCEVRCIGRSPSHLGNIPQHDPARSPPLPHMATSPNCSIGRRVARFLRQSHYDAALRQHLGHKHSCYTKMLCQTGCHNAYRRVRDGEVQIEVIKTPCTRSDPYVTDIGLAEWARGLTTQHPSRV